MYKLGDKPGLVVTILVEHFSGNRHTFIPGRKADSNDIKASFTGLGFEHILLANAQCTTANLTTQLDIIANRQENAAIGCIVLFFMSHGGAGGILCTYDGTLLVDSVIAPFRNSNVLVGRPKIFVFETCRGLNRDMGKMKMNSDVADMVIPTGSDELVVYSALAGHVAFVDPLKGGWLIRSFLTVMNAEETKHAEFMTIVKKVIIAVSEKSADSYGGVKQLVNYSGSLHKDLFLNRAAIKKGSDQEPNGLVVGARGGEQATFERTTSRIRTLRKSSQSKPKQGK